MKVNIGFLAAAVLALAACSSQNTQQEPLKAEASTPEVQLVPSQKQLLGTTWVVEDINQEGIIDSSRATLNFDDKGRVAGRSFCNRYMGDYQEHKGALKMEQLAGTMMACPKAIMLAEQKFLKALQDVQSYQFDENGALLLKADDKVLIKAYAETPAAE